MHPVVFDMPAGIKVETPSPTEILIKGSDRQRGSDCRRNQGSPSTRALRGKGIRYADEKSRDQSKPRRNKDWDHVDQKSNVSVVPARRASGLRSNLLCV